MKILLDECLPKKLKNNLPGHEVMTVPEKGWAGTKNGMLLKRAAQEFNAFITLDKGLTYQQNLSSTEILIISLRAPSSQLQDLVPLMPLVLKELENTSEKSPKIIVIEQTPT